LAGARAERNAVAAGKLDGAQQMSLSELRTVPTDEPASAGAMLAI
jgi:hypothetical protein